jgi:hypothetical protein
LNASDVIQALRVHYGAGWVLLEQVGDTTGYGVSRHLDAVAISLWPSRGLEVHGIEVKISRADAHRELSHPEKAEAIASRCDRFWMATPAGIIDAENLKRIAPSWGLLEVSGSAGHSVVKTRVQAGKHEPEPLDRTFVAALLRRVPIPTDAVRREIEESERTRLEANFDRRVADAVERATHHLEEIAKQAKVFAERTGIDLAGEQQEWHWLEAEGIAAAVLFLARQRGARWDSLGSRLEVTANTAEREANRLMEIAQTLRESATTLKIDTEASV